MERETWQVDKILRRYEDDVPPIKQRLSDGEDRLLVAEVLALRSELDEARKALERLASVEAFTTPFMRRDNAEGLELVARIDFAERAAAIRQKGESDEG